ncbi:DUF6065 family protein [Afifella aestuarii]|uniref:DUF6065 family protein n=1 Tax=Afifella aestuarii TaxID=1909496 RepID=UPI00196AD785|nr:DUF6065 family protein [Afifella aestuarii]
MSKKYLDFYMIDGSDIVIRPAPRERRWMDQTSHRFAYRCLPLAIANAHCWEILNPVTFTASWDGTDALEAIDISYREAHRHAAMSHFGHGILTFTVPALIRTPPGYDLWVMGPPNLIKADIQALNGVVETDWATATFTMNWRFTRPGARVTFEKDEPFCAFFPIRRGEIETFQTRRRTLGDDPELAAAYHEWAEGRRSFNEELASPDSDAARKKWQRDYLKGPHEALSPPHRTKVVLHKTKKTDD